eukprot:5680119-Amphidinium_carterae.1
MEMHLSSAPSTLVSAACRASCGVAYAQDDKKAMISTTECKWLLPAIRPEQHCQVTLTIQRVGERQDSVAPDSHYEVACNCALLFALLSGNKVRDAQAKKVPSANHLKFEYSPSNNYK